MDEHFLLLYPKNPAWAPASLAPLLDALKAISLLGAERGAALYSAGADYLGLVTYLGCSPQIALGDNEAATAIRVAGIFETPQFVQGANLKPPRCPRCRKPLKKPVVSLAASDELQCSHCGHAACACAFDWRHSACCARVRIEISNVFESEAVPGETLAACLEQASGEVWDYCYVRRG